MVNPFKYGGVVGNGSFCNRVKEIADLKRAMENGDRLFIYSERRLGKTSLVKRALQDLPGSQIVGAYIDLWPTDGEASFAIAVAKAITESLSGTADKMLEVAQRFFSRLLPAITSDSEGRPQVTFSFRESGNELPDLDEVLRAPRLIAEKRKRRVVLVFDEFQRILEYGSDKAERTLRSAIQDQSGVSFIFLGSKKHLIQKMFLDQNRPLYRSGGHYPIGPIDLESWKPFIRNHFQSSGKSIEDSYITMICEHTGGHPFYTQHLCHAVWELCEQDSGVTESMIELAIALLLERENYAYTSLWDSFGLNHRRILKGLAVESPGPEIFGTVFITKYNLSTPSSVQRAVNNLLARDVIDRDGNRFFISDRFFKIWIRRGS
ncbi:MAG: ATP-binding protein [Candidatus Krumholzibacteriota bacterium]|nr:ATP-binding protein [Candidatus Krumholzibacteriota bacterium]